MLEALIPIDPIVWTKYDNIKKVQENEHFSLIILESYNTKQGNSTTGYNCMVVTMTT